MGKIHQPRSGSLQFWPRKRASKLVPRVNWKPLTKKYSDKKLLGFIGYKAGMFRLLVRDLTPDSLTKNKQILLPVSVLEIPSIKIMSVRFYKKDSRGIQVQTEVLADNLDKELKKKVKISKKKLQSKLDELEKKLDEFYDIRIIVYTMVKKTGKKKKPDLVELGLGGSIKDKFTFVKENLGKELNFKDFFETGTLVDVHGLTKGKGLIGPVKRFGIGLKQHKSEKGRRRPGNIGSFTPRRTTMRAPQAGQGGMFTRISYNKKVLDINNKENLDKFSFRNYGKVNTDYIIVKGSVQGAKKRALVLSLPLRETKKRKKKNYEIIKIEK